MARQSASSTIWGPVAPRGLWDEKLIDVLAIVASVEQVIDNRRSRTPATMWKPPNNHGHHSSAGSLVSGTFDHAGPILTVRLRKLGSSSEVNRMRQRSRVRRKSRRRVGSRAGRVSRSSSRLGHQQQRPSNQFLAVMPRLCWRRRPGPSVHEPQQPPAARDLRRRDSHRARCHDQGAHRVTSELTLSASGLRSHQVRRPSSLAGIRRRRSASGIAGLVAPRQSLSKPALPEHSARRPTAKKLPSDTFATAVQSG